MLERVHSIEDGVKKLLNMRERAIPSFHVIPKKEGEYIDTLVLEGREIPLFDVRYDHALLYLYEYGEIKKDNSTLNVYSFTGSDVSLDQLMFKEMEIAEFLLHDRICAVTAFATPHAVNMILHMEDGTAANIDLGNTMAPGSQNQCQHRLITKRGTACDRSVAEMVVQNQVLVYGSNQTEPLYYDDNEVYLYGMSEEEIRKVMAIHAIINGKLDCSEWAQKKARLIEAIAAVHESAKRCATVYLRNREEAAQ